MADMTAPALETAPVRRNWGGRVVTDKAIQDATGVHRSILSRLRRGLIRRPSVDVARAFATTLSWPIGDQFEAHARGVACYSAQLDAAAIRAGLAGPERAQEQAARGVSPWPGALPQLPASD